MGDGDEDDDNGNLVQVIPPNEELRCILYGQNRNMKCWCEKCLPKRPQLSLQTRKFQEFFLLIITAYWVQLCGFFFYYARFAFSSSKHSLWKIHEKFITTTMKLDRIEKFSLAKFSLIAPIAKILSHFNRSNVWISKRWENYQYKLDNENVSHNATKQSFAVTFRWKCFDVRSALRKNSR